MIEFSAEKLPAFIVVFREFLEIAIVLGVVIAATRGLANRKRFIWAGIIAGVLGSLLVAFFAEGISNAAEGMGQELFNAAILLTASAVIGWTVLWMRSHARQMTAHIKKVGAQITEGTLPAYTITVIIGLAVLREGAEIVLFTYGMLASGQALFNVIVGGILGAVAGSIFGLALYLGIITIPVRYVFQVTSWMLIFLSAGMASLAAKYLVAGGAIDWLTNKLWDSSWLLSEDSIVGQILHALVGYSDQPMAIQLVFFAVTLGLLASIMRLMDSSQKVAK
jgi:high-affinity iron transporter